VPGESLLYYLNLAHACDEANEFYSRERTAMATIADREPLEFDGRWLWHPVPDGEDLESQPDYLPPNVFRRLAGFIAKPPHVTDRVKAYPTERAAVSAFKDAMRRAGLPVEES
jgi:hypothetical protein